MLGTQKIDILELQKSHRAKPPRRRTVLRFAGPPPSSQGQRKQCLSCGWGWDPYVVKPYVVHMKPTRLMVINGDLMMVNDD